MVKNMKTKVNKEDGENNDEKIKFILDLVFKIR